MKRGRQLKSKLRQYSSASSNNDSTHQEPSTTSATSSVTEKLAKLRIEQSRAVANRQRRHIGSSSFDGKRQQQSSATTTAIDSDAPWLHPWAALVAPGNEAASTTNSPSVTMPHRPARPAAGPPPPPSWTRMRPSQQQKLSSSTRLHSLEQHRLLLLKRQHQRELVSSLVSICCCQLAQHYTNALTDSAISSTWWIDLLKKLPAHIKQRILYEWSFISGDNGITVATKTGNLQSTAMVNDSTIDIFQKTDYEELWLEACHLSLDRLIQGFWKVDLVTTAATTATTTTTATIMADELVDDWEDLLEEDATTIQEDDGNGGDDSGVGGNFDDTLPTFILHMDQQEEIGKWSHIYQVMKFLRPDMDNNNNNSRGIPNLPGTSSVYALSSPFLGRTLVSLNISFMTLPSRTDFPFSWVTFSYLMVSTLPHLMWLYSAGCFDGTGGGGGGDVIQGTRVLSILSHGLRKLKFWDLCYYDWLQLDPLTSVVDWRRDLLELKTLCLSSSSSSPLFGSVPGGIPPSSQQKAAEISRWFKDHQLSRINIIWIDL